MARIVIIDTVYGEFLRTVPFDFLSTYDAELQKVLDRQFGTADFYSRNLKKLGWDCLDVIANHERLQLMWAVQNGCRLADEIMDWQMALADIVFLQDLSIPINETTRQDKLIAAQCSCPWPGDDNIRKAHVMFTSFPHYVSRIEALGVRAVYLPLAFEPSVLKDVEVTHLLSTEREFIDHGDPERDIDISFVGGVGRDLHWKAGTDVLETVAMSFPERFQWWGYGVERLPESSPLRACYKGSAWGKDQYSIYRRSKIVINRHGEVAEGFANNLRMYEATGCGAALVTDNQTDLFTSKEIVKYTDASHAVSAIRYLLTYENARKNIAASGQARTLRDHTYEKRMQIVSETLKEMLCLA